MLTSLVAKLERAPRTVLNPLSIDAITTNYYETLKVDLAKAVRAGVVASPSNGHLEFALPWFGEFAMKL